MVASSAMPPQSDGALNWVITAISYPVLVGWSPGPFASTLGQFVGDPVFPDKRCNGTALLCNNSRFALWNLVTIGSVEMVTSPRSRILTKPNTQATAHPFWSSLGGYLASTQSRLLSCIDEDIKPECLAVTACDLTKTYANMADLDAAAGSFPNQCINYYAPNTLRTTLNGEMTKYNDVNSGYDDVFGYCQSAMKEMVPGMIQEFMSSKGQGNKFFECTVTADGGYPITGPCPPEYRDFFDSDVWTITYKLPDEKGFYDTLQSSYGIQRDWVKFDNRHGGKSGTSCSKSRMENDACYFFSHNWRNEAQAADSFVVPNPKDTIANSLPSIRSLQNTMLARQMDLNTGIWTGSSENLIQTFAMPVYIVSQAIGSMAQAKDLGQQQAKMAKVDLIILILSAIFAVIPFAVDLLSAVAAASAIARGVVLIAEAGNIALSIESIVTDPASAPLVILGLLGAGRGRKPKDYASIADKQKLLKDTDIANIGKEFKIRHDGFQKTVKPRCKT
ncbi:uncharacterized protein B0I36DRAFT_370307 [Microdochium trichocladiopsis]|uniref:Uncharacterized protein n=1 Tax=Microdochium trichocladiopsis TaxID=1682393 RepID=A0A9P8XR51_9PEZI|nr:uncharacterized protein B0I36DRAFT_370307 [Microdochium trichocladiopsis]KAH7009350.1 hypothetical protein B0I36DRAFT_370307 [Microdochium trichocladiopsis]